MIERAAEAMAEAEGADYANLKQWGNDPDSQNRWKRRAAICIAEMLIPSPEMLPEIFSSQWPGDSALGKVIQNRFNGMVPMKSEHECAAGKFHRIIIAALGDYKTPTPVVDSEAMLQMRKCFNEKSFDGLAEFFEARRWRL